MHNYNRANYFYVRKSDYIQAYVIGTLIISPRFCHFSTARENIVTKNDIFYPRREIYHIFDQHASITDLRAAVRNYIQNLKITVTAGEI